MDYYACDIKVFFTNYHNIPSDIYALIIGGGLIFGVGQLCFSTGIKRIGVSLSFPINIGIGVGIGSIFVILHRHLLNTMHGIIVSIAVLVILAALYLFYRFRTDTRNPDISKKQYRIGWLLDIVAGCASGLQNIVFVLASGYGYHPSALAKLYWVWPIFLTAAAIPMLIGFYYLSRSSSKQPNYHSAASTLKNVGLIILMGIGFTGSLVFYSFAMEHLNRDQQIIGWPLFMVSIVLTCQIWGWVLKEFKHLNKKYKQYNLWGVALLIIAIIILGLSGLR